MERPERPTRHKSRPVKFNFSSDSDSDQNDSDVSMPLYMGSYMPVPEPSLTGAGPSASQPDGPSSTTEPSTSNSQNVRGASPTVTTVTLSPMTVTQEAESQDQSEGPIPLAPRRKRCLLESFRDIEEHINNLPTEPFNGGTSTRRADREIGVSMDMSPERSPWLPSRSSSIRLRPFCQIKCGNAYHNTSPPSATVSRPSSVISAPIRVETEDNREQPAPGLVVTSSFSLREPTSVLPSNSEASSQTPFFRRPPEVPETFRVTPDIPSGSSSILRHFDEMCSTPIRKRHRPMSIRLNESTNTSSAEARPSRFSEGASQSEQSNNPINFSTRSSNVDDYSDIVGHFLFNYTNSTDSADGQSRNREPFRPTRTPPASTSSEAQPRPPSNDLMLTALRPPSNDLMMNALNALLENTRTNNNDPTDTLDHSTDDVIVVETPDIEELVPSSRSPSPVRAPPPAPAPPPPAPRPAATTTPISQAQRDKAAEGGSGAGGDVPMTLQELNQSLVSLLECPVCLDHATPPIYQCCKGHILCQNCHPRLTSCPICRSRLPGDRNSAMEKVAEKLMYPCKNTVTGCTMMVKLAEKQSHEEGCGFRHYACVVSNCPWKGYKPELVVHLQSHHPDKLITGTTKEVRVPLMPAFGGAMVFSHEWIHSAHNEVFNVLFKIDLYKRIMKGCVIYIGSPERSSKFSYHFVLKQSVPPYRRLSYSRSTHCEIRQPMCLNNDFSINIDMARIYRPDNCLDTTIPVFITISQEE